MAWQWDNVHTAMTMALVDSTNESNSYEVSCSCVSDAEVVPKLLPRAVTRSLQRPFCIVLLPVAISSARTVYSVTFSTKLCKRVVEDSYLKLKGLERVCGNIGNEGFFTFPLYIHVYIHTYIHALFINKILLQDLGNHLNRSAYLNAIEYPVLLSAECIYIKINV